MIIVGNSECLERDSKWRLLIKELKKEGCWI